MTKCFSDFPININLFCHAASSLIGDEFSIYSEFEQDFIDLMSNLKSFAVYEDRI